MPFSDIPSEMASHLQRLTYSPEDLIASISNSIKMHDHDVRASKTFLGRVVAQFSQAQDPDWIEIDGTRLAQLLELSKTEPPMTLLVSEIYQVEVAALRRMLKSVSG